MTKQFYTVEQIAHMLNIHPKTIQRYIREGKLHATKIGKGWRINGHDLSLFTEGNTNNSPEESALMSGQSRVKSTSVIDIRVDNKDEAYRIINSLNAAMNVKPHEYGEASLATQYIERDCTVRLTLWGSIQFMVAIFNMVETFLDQEE